MHGLKGPATCQLLVILSSIPWASVQAAPVAALPINSQLPPVAFVGQHYVFEISASTFSTSLASLQYALSDAPAWLHLDSSTRTLSGSPALSDAGTAHVSLVATDSSGSTSMPFTLIVSTSSGPGVNSSATALTGTSGTLEDSGGVLYYPSQPVSISFSSGVFTNTDSNTLYYATSANNTPLPSWLNFNAQNLSFSGVAPQATSPLQSPQSYVVRLAASNVPGFYTAQLVFSITIAVHEFYFEESDYKIIANPGQAVTYSGLRDALLLDKSPVKPSELKSVNAILPAWLSFNDETFTFSGVAPMNLHDGAVAVFAEDIYGNSANATVAVTAGSGLDLITKSIGPLHAVAGEEFNFTVGHDAFISSDVKTSMNTSNASSWLTYNNVSLELSGTVPRSLTPQSINLTLDATFENTTESQSIILDIFKGTTSTKGASSSSVKAATPTTQSPTQPQSQQSSNADSLLLAAAVIIPIIALLAVLLLIFCIRSKKARQSQEKQPIGLRKYTGIRRLLLPRVLARKRSTFPPGMRYSANERAQTPLFDVNHLPQIEVSTVGVQETTKSPRQVLRPLSDIGQSSRRSSLAQQISHSRCSSYSLSHENASYKHRMSQNTGIPEDAPGHTNLGSQPCTSTCGTGRCAVAYTSMSALQARQRGVKDPRLVWQAQGAARGRVDRLNCRSGRGVGHGRPLSTQDLQPTARGESFCSYGSAMGTETTGCSSHVPMNSTSSQDSYMGFPQQAQISRAVVPQTVHLERFTIRPVDLPLSNPEPTQQKAIASHEPDLPEQPSSQSDAGHHGEAAANRQQEEYSSVSAYTESRKSSCSRSVPSMPGGETPIRAPRMRPALDRAEAQRVSAFYASRSNSNSARRKGSMIHDRYKEPPVLPSPVLDPDMYYAHRFSRSGFTQPSGFPTFARRRSRSSGQSSPRRGTTLPGEWPREVACFEDSRDGGYESDDVIVPAPLHIRHSSATESPEALLENAAIEEAGLQVSTPDLLETEYFTTGTVAHRPVSVAPPTVEAGAQLAPMPSLRASIEHVDRRDMSLRFL